ncbi:MAG: hypothetical protein N4A46_01010 [Schleiferiaceae bacterium]|jgi:hypothetical protein|nr:hypothetical protein [Schleiferiaceae bacterium]
MKSLRIWALLPMLALGTLASAQGYTNEAKHNIKLELPSLALVRVIDGSGTNMEGQTITLNQNPTFTANMTAGDAFGSGNNGMFPFKSNTYKLQYTFLPAFGKTDAKITVAYTTAGAISGDFASETEVKLNITGNGSNYNTFSSTAPAVSPTGGSLVLSTTAQDVMEDIKAGWTGIATTSGDDLEYEWDLVTTGGSGTGGAGDPTMLAGKTQTVEVVYTIVAL